MTIAKNAPYTAKPNHPGATGQTTQLRDLIKQRPLRVLSETDWQHWQTRGYVVVPNAVPSQQLKAVTEMLWQFQEMDPNDPQTWYQPQRAEHKMTELNNTGMVEVYHHQSLWDNRQTPRLYDLFVDIWDREDLWVSLDRANLNPPNRAQGVDRRTDGFIHFDVDSTAQPLPVSVQGVLALSDQDETTGGFQCVPDLFEHFHEWQLTRPTNAHPFHPELGDYEIQSVPLKAGDMLVFNALLPHGVRPNRSKDRVRLAQYISMFPANFENESLRQSRIDQWQNQRPPEGDAFPGDPRKFEQKNFARAQLTELGERLLGLEPW